MTPRSAGPAASAVALEERAPSRSGAVRFAGATHPGLVRERNEDRLHVDPDRGLLIVVDGMGGAAAGETAAEVAISRLVERLEHRSGTAEERVREAITSANNEIVRLARDHPAWNGMGCVLTVALIEKGIVTVGHVGDSRLYRLHHGRVDKLTHDHSPIGMREDQGELDEREAMRHPRRHEVYRSVGTERHAARDEDWIELLSFPLEREHAILVCSDGLTDLVPSGEIARVARQHAGDGPMLVQRLVDAANAAGGKDNVTVAFAAGDRFAKDFTRAPAAIARANAGHAPARAVGGFFARRSTLFALGALTGIALYAGIQFQDRPPRREARATPDPALAPVATRHEVGEGRTFHAIGDALAAARSGDTVAVHPGRYREQVRLEEGVTLIGTDPGGAVIEPLPAGDGAGPVAALVAEGIGSGRVSGLVIAGGAHAPIDYGIVIRRAAVTVENVDVRGARVAGVSIEDAGAAALIGSHVHDNPGAGVVVRGAGAPLVLGNRIVDNGRASPPAAGIEVAAPAEPRISGNVIAGNGAEGVRGLVRRSVLETNVFEAFGRGNARGAMGGARPGPMP